MKKINILFCCMGNICRSPMAEGLFRKLVEEAGYADRVFVDSAGTHADFPDSPPDPRAQKLMAERGIDIGAQRARRVMRADFERFDLILAMDTRNLDALRFVCPRSQAHKVGLLLDYAPRLRKKEVPDPYHADESVFKSALEQIEVAAEGLLGHLRDAFFL
jgi:protein-tyrosine phosphatase